MRYGINTVVEAPRDLPPGHYFLSEPECYMSEEKHEMTIMYKVIVEHEHTGYLGSHQHIGSASIDDHRNVQ